MYDYTFGGELALPGYDAWKTQYPPEYDWSDEDTMGNEMRKEEPIIIVQQGLLFADKGTKGQEVYLCTPHAFRAKGAALDVFMGVASDCCAECMRIERDE